ncbi:hypothetical protein [Kitasatospora camelliae]|uniref:UspA domain-containing protein n=1 Tax=Kitasatospora camelliae TaxID=3156397 RepID=A0AAU8JTE5_9ACTN
MAHPGLDLRADLAEGEEVVDVLAGAAHEAELLVLGSRGLARRYSTGVIRP